MAATNFTPIQLYFSTTASAVPTAANLAQGELAININDGKLYYEDSTGVVQVIATKGAGTIGGSTTQIQYNNAGALAGNAAMVFNSATSTTTLTTLNLTNALGAIYGGTAQSTYAQGDIVYASAANTLAKLGIGVVNYILTSTGSVPQWVAPSSIAVLTATNLAGGLAGSVPYQSALDTTTFLAIGAANRVMTSTGTAPQWVTSLTGLTGVSSSSITNTSLTSGRVVVSSTAGLQADSANLTFSGTILTSTGFAGPLNGTVGATTATTGAFTSLTASTTLGVTGVSTLTAGAVVEGLTVGLGAGAVSTNTAVGVSALAGANTNTNHVAVGYLALQNNTSGGQNVAVGGEALKTNTAGSNNIGIGFYALRLNTVSDNTAIGAYALSANTSGANNTAIGRDALLGNLSASNNTAVGYQAGYTGSTTTNNAFVGYQAGYSVTTGTGRSVFLGAGAGFSTTSGIDNVAVGMNALFSNQIGGQNVVIGSGEFGIALHAGYYVTGSKNTLIGYSAGNAITTGSKNTIIGGYNGNQGGLDIRTADNRIVLSDGDGNPRGIFDSSGNFGIGTTSPRAKFEVNGVGSFGDGVAATPTITFGNELTVGMFRAGNAILGFSTGSTERMRIDSSGIVTMNAYGAGAATFSSAGVISSVSDETWKVKDGVPTDPDAMLKKLEPGYWYYNDEKKEIFGTERQLGFYAQNVNAAIGPEAAPEPETITTKNKDGIETTVTKPWGYYDRSVLAITVMSLQKALATIETLTDRITALETA